MGCYFVLPSDLKVGTCFAFGCGWLKLPLEPSCPVPPECLLRSGVSHDSNGVPPTKGKIIRLSFFAACPIIFFIEMRELME